MQTVKFIAFIIEPFYIDAHCLKTAVWLGLVQ